MYIWENHTVHVSPENHDINADAANYLAKRVWEHFECARPRPKVYMGATQPIAHGYGAVYLGRYNRTIATALHELTHARGFGFQHQAHTVGFVLAYIETLAWWFRWDWEELFLSARFYKLC